MSLFQRLIARRRLLLSILVPVVLAGIVLSVVVVSLITPPILTSIRSRIDAELAEIAEAALEICDGRMDYLLNQRLEDDQALSEALRTEAVKEIVGLAGRFEAIELLVVAAGDSVVGASEGSAVGRLVTPGVQQPGGAGIRHLDLGGSPVRSEQRYFPFWNWTVVAYIHEARYEAPLALARNAIVAGMVGLLLAVWLVLLVVLDRQIRVPLQRLTDATDRVARGDLTPLRSARDDEIGRVIAGFNAMVASLEYKNSELDEVIAALRESEQSYRVLFEGAAEGILVVDQQTGAIQYANPAICRLLDYTEAEIRRLSIEDLQPPAVREERRRQFQAIVRGEGDDVLVDAPCVTRDGRTVFTDIRANPVVYRGRDCILGFLTDTGARRAAEQQRAELEERLQRSEKMEAIGLLAGGVAHDLNNILGGLASYPELLLMDLPEDSPLREPLKTIERSGWRAAAIVQDLLTLARRGVAVNEVVDLHEVITEYFGTPEHQHVRDGHPEVEFRLTAVDGPVNVLGSPTHLNKAVANLVSNAAEAMPDGRGRVEVTLGRAFVDQPIRGYDEVIAGNYAVVTVKDDGMGIAADDLPRIFEPFYTRKVLGRSGTGLGMAVVWGAVKDHHGYIDVESTVDVGTTFTLYVPLTEARRDESDDQSVDSLMGRGEHILVVDDIQEQRELARHILERLGYRVSTVGSGEDAVAFLSEQPVALVVLDMIMGQGLDGLATYQRIIADHPHQRAIIASGFSEDARVREAQRLGVRQYVRKPYTLVSFGLAVRSGLVAEEARSRPDPD